MKSQDLRGIDFSSLRGVTFIGYPESEPGGCCIPFRMIPTGSSASRTAPPTERATWRGTLAHRSANPACRVPGPFTATRKGPATPASVRGCGRPERVDMTKSIAATDRLLAKTRETPEGCWEWTAHVTRKGYGCFSYRGKSNQAHRIAYELFVGPVPDGLVVDHLCRNRACVNPDHLEPVTNRENILRGVALAAQYAVATHCVHGHPFDDENTAHIGGRRRCRACRRIRNAQYRALHKAAV